MCLGVAFVTRLCTHLSCLKKWEWPCVTLSIPLHPSCEHSPPSRSKRSHALLLRPRPLGPSRAPPVPLRPRPLGFLACGASPTLIFAALGIFSAGMQHLGCIAGTPSKAPPASAACPSSVAPASAFGLPGILRLGCIAYTLFRAFPASGGLFTSDDLRGFVDYPGGHAAPRLHRLDTLQSLASAAWPYRASPAAAWLFTQALAPAASSDSSLPANPTQLPHNPDHSSSPQLQGPS